MGSLRYFEAKLIILTNNNLGRASGRPQSIMGSLRRIEAKLKIMPNNKLDIAFGGPFLCLARVKTPELRLKYCCPEVILAEPPVDLFFFLIWKKGQILI